MANVTTGLRWLIPALLCLASAWPGLICAVEYRGRVFSVIDGDSFTLQQGDGFIEVRLYGIDAPELAGKSAPAQPKAWAAKQRLTELIEGAEVLVIVEDRDDYGRTVARVYRDMQNIALEMIYAGLAWVYRRYTDDPQFIQAEATAQRYRQGIWALPADRRIPPWQWRHKRDNGTLPKDAATTTDATDDTQEASSSEAGLGCEPYKHCTQIQTCREARHRLDKCEHTRLDGDGDGIPCEALCVR